MKTKRAMQKKLRRIKDTERVIKKRIKIIREEWGLNLDGYNEPHPWLKQENRVNKFNLKCGCRVCRMKHGTTKQQKILKDKAKIYD